MDNLTTVSKPTWDSLEEYITVTYSRYHTVLVNSSIPNDGYDLATAVKRGRAFGVTNTSVNISTNNGAVSWIISTKNNRILADGSSACPKYYRTRDSFGDEIFGIFCILLATKLACEYHGITTGTLTIACDNDASLDSSCGWTENIRIERNYFDLLWAIYDLKVAMSITIVPKRVEGHADCVKTVFNFFEKLNILMDSCAKTYRNLMDASILYTSITTFDPTHWSILIHGTRISYKIEDQIKDHIQGRFVRQRLIQRGDLTHTSFDFVDWDSIDSASRSMTVGDSLWVTKICERFFCYRRTHEVS